jgi:hypothetical protein
MIISIKMKTEVDQNFTISDRAGLAELDTCDTELLDEETGP